MSAFNLHDMVDHARLASTMAARLDTSGSSAESISEVPELVLHVNYQTAFTEPTAVTSSQPDPGMVAIEVLNVLGRRVQVVAPAVKSAGIKRMNVEHSGLVAGGYACRVKSSSASGTAAFTRMLVMGR